MFAEEVEQALLEHAAVADAVVVGRASDRWGSEVVAIVALHQGASVDDDELLSAAGARLARYKLPITVIRVDEVRRTPVGKIDFAWARDVALRS